MPQQTSLGPYGLPELLLSKEQIQTRVEELGAAITADFAGQEVTLLGILKGSFLFMADLARAIDLPVMCEFMGISSYGEQTQNSGEVRIIHDLKHPIEGLNVVIVEDIVDSGLTMEYLLGCLTVRRPAQLKICSLLHKTARTQATVDIDYVGFTIPDHFVVGYGLDFKGRYRNLQYIGHFDNNPGATGGRNG